MTIWVLAVAGRVGWNVVWILQPPSVCQISLSQYQTSCGLGDTTCDTTCVRKLFDGNLQVREYRLGINFWYCVTGRSTGSIDVELQLTGT